MLKGSEADLLPEQALYQEPHPDSLTVEATMLIYKLFALHIEHEHYLRILDPVIIKCNCLQESLFTSNL